jgi:hypothetical protein
LQSYMRMHLSPAAIVDASCGRHPSSIPFSRVYADLLAGFAGRLGD